MPRSNAEMKSRRVRRAFLRDRGGASALEFAIVGPMFLMILIGILCYGGYFWMAHAVQQVANDAARVAVGGLNTAERETLAKGVVSGEIGDYALLSQDKATVTVGDNDPTIKITVSYDASQTPFFALWPLVPMPSPSISRSATVRLGGY